MKLKLFPELERFPNKKDRKKAYAKAQKLISKSGWFYLWLILSIVLLINAKLIFIRQFNPPRYLTTVFVLASMQLIFCIQIIIFRKRMEKSIRMDLNDAGIITCMKCGYDLRGQVEPRCSECGREFELLGSAHDNQNSPQESVES